MSNHTQARNSDGVLADLHTPDAKAKPKDKKTKTTTGKEATPDSPVENDGAKS